MAALTGNVDVKFDPRWDIGMIQQPSGVALDIFYRGGLAHLLNDGTGISITPADADFYMGVVLEGKTAVICDLIWLGTAGRWFFTCAAFVLADLNLNFGMNQADLFDNPASLIAAAATQPGSAGVLWHIGTTAQDGWLNTDHRSAIYNA
jgi:hypothetical protein